MSKPAKRTITISIAVLEEYRTVASAEFTASVEMFAPATTTIALVNGIRQVLAEADERKADESVAEGLVDIADVTEGGVAAAVDELAEQPEPGEAVPA